MASELEHILKKRKPIYINKMSGGYEVGFDLFLSTHEKECIKIQVKVKMEYVEGVDLKY